MFGDDAIVVRKLLIFNINQFNCIDEDDDDPKHIYQAWATFINWASSQLLYSHQLQAPQPRTDGSITKKQLLEYFIIFSFFSSEKKNDQSRAATRSGTREQ